MIKYGVQWRTILLFLVFFSTIALLGKQIFFPGASVPSSKSDIGGQGYQQVTSIVLGEVEVRNYQRMGFTRGQVRFSPDGTTLAVGTENGTIILFDNKGQVLWRRDMGLGKITALEFAKDGQSVFVGETSVDGNLYCLDAVSGKERWKQSSAADLGVDVRGKIYPGIVHIVSDTRGFVYAVSQKYGKSKDGGSEYEGRIYSFGKNGELRWQFPEDDKLDAWVNWISVDQDGRSLAFGTANFDTDKTYHYGDNIYLLQGEKGTQIWSQIIPPTSPYNRTVMRGSPNLSEDGQYLTALASDGRAFLYDAKGQEVWQRVLSAPKKIGGVYLNAVGRDAYVINDTVICATINTYNNTNWQLSTPVEHPSSNSVFMFDLSGKMTGRWQAGGSIEEMAFGHNMAVAGVGRNTKTRDDTIHGMYILNLTDAQLEERLPTVGPCIAVGISPKEDYLASIEAPLQKDDGQIIGDYRLSIWKKR